MWPSLSWKLPIPAVDSTTLSSVVTSSSRHWTEIVCTNYSDSAKDWRTKNVPGAGPFSSKPIGCSRLTYIPITFLSSAEHCQSHTARWTAHVHPSSLPYPHAGVGGWGSLGGGLRRHDSCLTPWNVLTYIPITFFSSAEHCQSRTARWTAHVIRMHVSREQPIGYELNGPAARNVFFFLQIWLSGVSKRVCDRTLNIEPIFTWLKACACVVKSLKSQCWKVSSEKIRCNVVNVHLYKFLKTKYSTFQNVFLNV